MMIDRPLDEMIEAMRRRVDALLRRQYPISEPAPGKLVQELETAMEELRVASEELHQQYEELLATREQVEDERRRYRELFEFAPDGYLVTDTSGVIREANQAAADLLGVACGKLAGKPLIVYVAGVQRRELSTLLGQLTEEGRIEGWEVELQPQGGDRIVASISAAATRDAAGTAVGIRWMVRNVTRRHQAEDAIRRYVNRLEVLGQMDRAVLGATSLRGTAGIALDYLRRLVPCRRASIALIDATRGALTVLAALADGETALPDGAASTLGEVFAPASIALLLRGEWRAVEDTRAIAEPTPWERALREEGVGAFINVPLMIQGELAGSLNVGMAKPGPFGPEDREVVQEVADRLAVAIQQSRLIDQVRRQAAELERRVEERTADLQASEERLRLVLDQLPAMVWTTDRDLTITSASGSGLAAVRLSRERMVGKNLRDYRRLARAPIAAVDIHERVLRGEHITYEAEFRGHVYQSHVEPFINGHHTIVGCLGVAVDVTSHKRAEEALRETKDRLVAINRRLHALNAVELGAQELLEVEDITALVVRQLAALGIESAVLLREQGHLVVRSISLDSEELARVEAILGVPLLTPVSPEGAKAWPTRKEARQTAWVPNAVELVAEMMPGTTPRAVARAARFVGLTGAIVSPLVARGTNIGLLILWGNDLNGGDVPAVAGFANQLAVAIDNAVLFSAIRQQGQRLRSMAARLAEAEEAERRLMARELHDQVGQNLSALSLSLSALREQVRTLPEGAAALVRQRLDDALALVRETAERARDIMTDLRPPVLDDYGLMAAFRWYAEGLGRRTSLAVTLRGQEPEPRLPPPVEMALFRIAQEALMNVAMHADTDEASVSLETGEEAVRLTIADSGIGFEPSEVIGPQGHVGWGLMSIEERAEAVGGRAHIESKPGQGTRVTVEVPR